MGAIREEGSLTERTYSCDMCRRNPEYSPLHCVEWKSSVDMEVSPNSRRDILQLKEPQEVLHMSERHMCSNCIRDIEAIAKILRERKSKQ